MESIQHSVDFKEARFLKDIAVTLFGSFQLKEVLNGVLERLLGFMGTESGIIDLQDPQTRDSVLLVHQGLSQESLREIQRLKSSDIFLNRLTQGELVVVNNLSQEMNFGFFIPIISNNNPLGTIFCCSMAERQVTPSEAAMLLLMGELLGVAVERLRLSEMFYRGKIEWENSIDAMIDGIFLIDREYRILRINKSLAEMLGRSVRELIGQKWHLVFYHEGKPIEHCPCRKAMESRKIAHYTMDEPHLNRSFIISASPIFDANGDIIGCVGTIRDITEKKKMEAQLEEEKRHVEDLYTQLQAAFQKLKDTQEEMIKREKLTATGEIAIAIAHEIRNPLSIISMSVQYIHSRLDPNDPLRECTKVLLQKIERLNNLTKELINYGRPREMNLKSVNLHRSLNSVLRLARAKCAYKKVEIIRHYDLMLPPISMDEEQMDEVFINIIENALDVMPNGGKLLIATDLDLEGKRAVIKFSNNGKGIPPKYRYRIFEPFFTTKKEGTGLGLTICQRIINYHGGGISYESKISGKQKGTTFIVTLPIPPEDPGSEEIQSKRV